VAQTRRGSRLTQGAQRLARRVVGRAAVALVAFGCAAGGHFGDDLTRRFPSLDDAGPHRLGDAHPYLLPSGGRATFFACRWSTEAPVPVSLPLDATPSEREALLAALRAWEGTGLGVRFLPVDGGDASIRIELAGGPVESGAGRDTGNAIVDCRVAPLSRQRDADAVAGAELVAARIVLARRTDIDWQGRERALTQAELAGAALHELGHALGFQGHARQGDTAMVRELERIPRTGAAILDGAGFRDSTMRALYALPNGAVVRRVPVEAWRTDLVDRMARLAEGAGLDGPFARVGESAARVFWRDPRGQEYGLVVPRLEEVMRDPARLVVIPEPRTRRALPRGEDLRPEP
jgi:hypothetical protein